jgi:hypothetical protein
MDQRAARRHATDHLSDVARVLGESVESDDVQFAHQYSSADRARLATAYTALAAELHTRYHREPRPAETVDDPNQIDLFEETASDEVQA